MGVVWRAADTTLDREVAIKILPPLLQHEPERMARFEREAKLLASLNHPNIAAVHGLHTAEVDNDKVSFIAMELVPGADLAERLVRGPLPVDEALSAARRIAQALEAAHDSGTVHRDLKPANIKLTPDGTVKVLDFGLAKALAPDPASGSGISASLSPTMTSAGSVAGVILGTAGYMSPEQARGRPVDARTDVWAFGCVLWEMLTGKRLFEGETVSDILAEVLKTEPDWNRLPHDTPPAARRLLERCLRRDPKQRLQHIGDARIEIEEAIAEPGPPPPSGLGTAAAPTKTRERYVWLAVVAVLLAVLAAVVLRPGTAPSAGQPVQLTLMPPEGWDFAPASPLAVSRDGRRVAFVASPRPDLDDPQATTGLWIRDLDATQPRRLADTNAASYPFWSPDGRSVAFFNDGKLNRVSAAGGPVVPICNATDGRGGSWNASGTIVFQPGWTQGLMKVPAGGGTPEPITTLDPDRAEIAHRWPYFLPDGRHFLFYVVSTSNPTTSEYSGIYLGSLDSDETTFLLQSVSRGGYSGGHLLYRIGSTLMAHRFDTGTMKLSGEPFPVGTDVPGGSISWGGANFGASDDDVIVHMRGAGSADTILAWRDREGTVIETVGEPAGYWEPRLSHDGTRLAIAVGMDVADIWIYDLSSDRRTRFTFDPADDRAPLWSPDDRWIAFASGKQSRGEIWLRPTTGQSEAERAYVTDTNILLSDGSSDGRRILFGYRDTGPHGWDI